jgi:hypothetical protein
MLNRRPDDEETEISQDTGDYVATFLTGIVSGLGLGIGLFLIYKLGMKVA